MAPSQVPEPQTADQTGVEQPTANGSAGDVPRHRYTPALAQQIELFWQDRWEAEGTFHTPNPTGRLSEGFERVADRPKFFAMDMFPYPSGAGLHVGHPLGYLGTDVTSRFRRMDGDNVLHPMGFDAFGLPAEQFAVQTGQHPRITTEANIAAISAQLRRLGVDHDQRRTFATIDPGYYKWTQWIFLQIFGSWFDEDGDRARPIEELVAELDAGAREPAPGTNPSGRPWSELNEREKKAVVDAHRLAYLNEAPVNWCPGLGTVLVGDDPGSRWYVNAKHSDCAQVGIASIQRELPATATLADVLAVVEELNADPACTGYIVQLPLPAGIDESVVLEAMDPAKDADGLHPVNLGRLVLNVPGALPCTPVGIVELLRRYEVPIAGAEVVVVGRGITVGRPLGLLLTRRTENATVTLCHTGTRDLAAHVRSADVVVAAAGVPGLITADLVKPGAAVLDVGVSRVDGKIAGDVAPDVLDVAGFVAPNPGGVGPMTRAMLLQNVVLAAEQAAAREALTA